MTKQGVVKVAAVGLILASSIGAVSAQRGEEPPTDGPDYEVKTVTHALYTAPLTGFSYETYDCSVANVGKNPVAVKVQIFMEDGTNISAGLPPQSLPCEGGLDPGAVCHIKLERNDLSFPEINFTSAYCRILVTGSKESVRGALVATTRAALDQNGRLHPARSVTAEAH